MFRALSEQRQSGVVIGLNAVIVAVTENQPRVLVLRKFDPSLPRSIDDSAITDRGEDALPYGPFLPAQHRTLELGMRSWVEAQTDLQLGYVEQLYTFGDKGRDPREGRGGPRVVSVGYLALALEGGVGGQGEASWKDWYGYFPWEDWRSGKPRIIEEVFEPALKGWVQQGVNIGEKLERQARVELAFGGASLPWNEELVLERYELLYEAGLVEESAEDRAPESHSWPMILDHRRILATAVGRLRAKLKYRPVIFELMGEEFTLLQLQKVTESLAGQCLHKQNFRRLVEHRGLVERTGRREAKTGGRPAETFRFRSEVLLERPVPGVGRGRK